MKTYLNKDGTMPQKFMDKLAKIVVLKGTNKSQIAKAMKIDRETFSRWLDEFEEFRKIYEDGREEIGDLAESKMIENIDGGDQRAIEYWLNNRRPDDWRTKSQIAISGQIKTKVEIDLDDPDRKKEIARLRKKLSPQP